MFFLGSFLICMKVLKMFSNNLAKTVWKPDMTNISPELRKMFRERKQPEDGETK